MSNFEQIGCNRQYDAETRKEADIEFEISCYACTHSIRSGWRRCDCCQISLAHDYVVAVFNDAEAQRA